MTTFCACLIVKDEAAIVERCLDSVVGLCDTYVIVDTGSSDNTRDLIDAHPLPGELHEREWVDFGHNRSELLALAQGKADYLLLLDADMSVEVTEPLPELTVEQYMLRIPGEPDYRLGALVRGDRRWYSVGATHEYTHTDGPFRRENLDAIVLHHHCDGARRPEKFQRDLDLLLQEVAAEPENPRSWYYLANTERDLKMKDQAIESFRKRIELGGWDEETFDAMLQAAMLADDIAGLLAAWNFRPTRAEPLYELAWRCRNRGWHQVAYMVSNLGSELPVPLGDMLFVRRWVYDWGLEFELSIAAYNVGRVEEALAVCNRLLDNPELPAPYRAQVLRNRHFCQPTEEMEAVA
jgi:glycosyltransferase involved in cell wall biosynthesis